MLTWCYSTQHFLQQSHFSSHSYLKQKVKGREKSRVNKLSFDRVCCPSVLQLRPQLSPNCSLNIILGVEEPLLNYSSSQMKTHKQVCSFPTSHSLCMSSLTNTSPVGIFDPRCCLCNKHQRWERSQPGPVETRKSEEARWRKDRKLTQTETASVSLTVRLQHQKPSQINRYHLPHSVLSAHGGGALSHEPASTFFHFQHQNHGVE